MTSARIKHLGVIAAMDEEFALIAQRFSGGAVRSIGPRDFLSTSSGELSLTLVRSRIGKVAAASTASILLHQFNVDSVLFTGVAGGIHHEAHVGDVVVADALVQHDIDLRGVLGYQRFEIPLFGGPRIEACENLSRIAHESAQAVASDPHYQKCVSEFVSRRPQVHRGVIASGDVFVCSADERDELRSLIPSLVCVEMEGAAVAQVCAEHHVPFAVTRIISDSADDASPIDFPRFIRSAAAVGSDMFVCEFVRRIASTN